MSALPSFDFLIASLGLPDVEASHPSVSYPHFSHSRTSSSSLSCPNISHSRRSSCSSTFDEPHTPQSPLPALAPEIVFQSETPPRLSKCRSIGRLRESRYAPYLHKAHGRRPSLPTLLNDLSLSSSEEGKRPASPVESLPEEDEDENIQRLPAPKIVVEGQSLHLMLHASTPISTFVRRRTPVSSPTAPCYASRRRQSLSSRPDSVAPVLIPTIPSLPPLIASTMNPVETVDEKQMAFVVSAPGRKHSQQSGLKLSSWRQDS